MALQQVKQLLIDLAKKSLLVTARMGVHSRSAEMRVITLTTAPITRTE